MVVLAERECRPECSDRRRAGRRTKRPLCRVHLMLTEHQVSAMRALGEATGLSVAELFRRAVDGYLAGTARDGRGDRGGGPTA